MSKGHRRDDLVKEARASVPSPGGHEAGKLDAGRVTEGIDFLG